MNQEKIIVLDFGSQYNQLIVRRIRELNVYSKLYNYDISAKEILDMKNVKGIIFSGGPNSVLDKNAFQCDSEIFDLGIPILGICYGMQLISHFNEGIIIASDRKEYGRQLIEIDNNSLLFQGLSKSQEVWMSHGDQVSQLPQGFRKIASSETCEIAAISCDSKKIYGLQFHPEVTNTVNGMDILRNFVFQICNAKAEWSMDNFLDAKIKEIKDNVQEDKVLLGISGGVDSSVAAVLISKAIGEQLTCMFIDHGLLRKNEANEVMENFQKFGIGVVKVDARKKFLDLLSGVTDPEEKRKIIGKTFIDVFEEESKKFGDYKFLAQGTLYTDIIESGTKTAKVIKSHHNVGGLPKNMRFKLLEPINSLFKDEVRKLGLTMGMPEELITRQPFPGPGLGIRVIGEITEEKLAIVRDTDYILRDEFKKHGLNKSVWQYFTVLTGVKTVGVMGDNRTYAYTIAIRAVTSIDGMTSDWARIPYDVLDKISRRMVNEVSKCNRVVFDITSKPPATIEWE